MKTLPCLAMCLSPLLLASTPPRVAQHGPWTVFGQILGQPLTVPECRHKLMGDGTPFSTYEDDPAVTCYEPDIALRDAPWRRGSLDFPLRQIPLIIHGSSGFTLIVNGRLEGLEFDTLNYSSRRGIVSELSAKFGPPSSATRTTPDPAGIPVPGMLYEWNLPGLYVAYRDIDTSVDYGNLLIETSEMHALRLRHERDDAVRRTAL